MRTGPIWTVPTTAVHTVLLTACQDIGAKLESAVADENVKCQEGWQDARSVRVWTRNVAQDRHSSRANDRARQPGLVNPPDVVVRGTALRSRLSLEAFCQIEKLVSGMCA